ncbi:hypothetical protein [Erwinia pyrifoliae]|uniref:Uncharacterized protein n=1 Tax=Erwinia pyrifoliae TaxID=79967 RepID=A0ABY5X6B7_ERWPY|nr:hypothetical protein [Erwinia pyrifoliae]MCT2387691.1 hypothetical protein [Erwinia pyrifoliae]MCU8585947.1 hypothetical protein [Erwinia pyrifoliae]UWS28759.1 hypothetical protein NYP81_12505 [Erwinia pyrifoliae]UWS32901.1 hypothetical protein NYP84_14970 [Erwinia pyrifoliae]UXK11750.1 hypothetical protein NYP80_15820 [Erwinia pyrifoliae]
MNKLLSLSFLIMRSSWQSALSVSAVVKTIATYAAPQTQRLNPAAFPQSGAV